MDKNFNKQKTILILDDEEKIRRIYTDTLSLEGFNVLSASCGTDANEILNRNAIDLILLDINMSEVNGSIFYDIIQLFHKKTKVIVSSVYPIDEQKQKILDANEYHDKSQGLNILLKKIRQVLYES